MRLVDHFIELTNSTGSPVEVNLNRVLAIIPDERGSRLWFGGNDNLWVKESRDDIIDLIMP